MPHTPADHARINEIARRASRRLDDFQSAEQQFAVWRNRLLTQHGARFLSDVEMTDADRERSSNLMARKRLIASAAMDSLKELAVEVGSCDPIEFPDVDLKHLHRFANDPQTKFWSDAKATVDVIISRTSRSPAPLPVVFDAEDYPIVLGERAKSILSPSKRAVIDALLTALKDGRTRLTGQELDDLSGQDDSRKILSELARNDPVWERALLFPGKNNKGVGYGIKVENST